MALSAARTDLTVSVVGEDETQQAIEQANANMRTLEARLKALQAAGRGQATVAKTQAGALDTVNGKMKGLAGMSESVVEGLDKTKSAFDKVVGVAQFAQVAMGGLLVVIGKLIGDTIDLRGAAGEFADGMTEAAKAVENTAVQLRKLASESAGARVGLAGLQVQAFDLRMELAQLQGDTSVAKALKGAKAIAEGNARVEEGRAKLTEAVNKQREAEEALAKSQETRAKAATEAPEAGIIQLLTGQTAAFEGMGKVVEEQGRAIVKQLDPIIAKQRERVAQEELVVEKTRQQVDLLEQIAAERQRLIEQGKDLEDLAKPGARATARAVQQTMPDAEKEAQAVVDRLTGQLRALYDDTSAETEMEFERDMRAAEERRRKALDDARKQAEEAAKLQQELADKARFDMTEPVYAFADALRGSLIPELDAFTGVMDKVMAQFDAFREGQVSLTQAIAAGATEIVASAARSIGGVKAEAAVRAIYETAMGFATLATPVISAGHFTAAGLLAGVATGVISTGGGAAKSAAAGGLGKPASSTGMAMGSSGGGSGGSVTNVYNLNAGVVDGQSTTRAFRRAEVQSRNTGFAMAGGW